LTFLAPPPLLDFKYSADRISMEAANP